MSFITQKIYLLFIFPFIFFGILIDISSFVLNKIKFIYNKLNLKEGIMKGRIVMMLIYLFFSIGLLTAQDATVQGIVVSSEDNEPVVGASVLVVGTSLGVTTDIDGKFVIQNVPGTAKEIRVSYIGMQSQNMAISKGMMRIVLKIDAQVLDEVVVTAMGISRNKKALGYAATSVKGDEIANSRTVNPMNALQGKVAGVDISTAPGPGATQNVIIRGASSFGNNQPLYVVDGVPITNEQNRSGDDLNDQVDFGSGINALNPDDIADMTVLKGAAAKAEMQKKQKLAPAEPVKDFGFVSVTSGAGLEDLFKDLGVDVIVRGGQTMNPSTEDILEAINATPARNIFVLPNNKNIIMAAEQAVKLTDRNVIVLQTRTIPQGITAMLAFDESSDFSTNGVNMTKALDNVGSGSITFAVRDSDFEGKQIKKGEILAMENGKLAFVEKDVTKALIKITKKLIRSGSSYITIIYGSDVTDETAQAAFEALRAKISDDIEIVLVNGGQPVYYYLISVE